MIRFIRNFYLRRRFFLLFGAAAALFAFAFVFPYLFPPAQLVLLVGVAIVLVDVLLLFNKSLQIPCTRDVPRLLSLGSENTIAIHIENNYGLSLYVKLIDELPYQLQRRDFEMSFTLKPGEKKELSYTIFPILRGEYVFDNINIYACTLLGVVERKISVGLNTMSPVYPSVIHMKQFELKTAARISHHQGIKKLRRLGHSYEFEQIKNYVRGDDYRSINWKATGRKSELMVNQFEDEKAQQVYCLVDMSRSMKMPFNGLSLLDHSINTSLVISNTVLHKHDKAGLITFSDKIGSTLRADRGPSQLKHILEVLYRQTERYKEANYELLYTVTRSFVKGRSLLFLFTNFESYYSLERVLPILRKLSRIHLLVVVFFKNTEVMDYSRREAENIEQIYLQTVAGKYVFEKQQVIRELRNYGIQTILTSPEDLTINTLNKYIELKSRGMI